MKAAVLEKIDAPLTIAEVELGELGIGQVLVKVLVSGICGAQLLEIGGHKGNAKFVPHLLGHEGCGMVEAVGEGVTMVKKGDKVVMHWRKGDGIESDFPSYVFRGKTIRSGKVTTFSEYSIVSENRLTAVPNDTPNDLCALLGCGLSTALGVIHKEARVQPSESVLIVGCGGLGLSLIKAAKLAGASPVIAVDIHPHKEKIARELGADAFINASTENIPEALHTKSGNDKISVIIETSGNPKSIETTIPLLAGGGRYILVGQPKSGEQVHLTNVNHLFEGEGKTIKATQGGQFTPTADIPHYIQLHKDGILTIDALITHRVPLQQINEAIALIRSGNAGRIMIDISQ